MVVDSENVDSAYYLTPTVPAGRPNLKSRCFEGRVPPTGGRLNYFRAFECRAAGVFDRCLSESAGNKEDREKHPVGIYCSAMDENGT